MKRVIISAVTCALLFGATALQAKTDKRTLVKNEMAAQAKNHKVAPKEIILGMQNTFKALQALHMNKKDEAKKDLQTALASFDKALKANPKLDVIPVDERLQAFEFIGTSKDIQKALDLGQKLLKEHDTQTAIDVISPLKDELDITTMAIPMKIYPVAVKKALDALNKGDTVTAYNDIAEAMNSLIVFKTVIPTPLLVAQDLVVTASKLDKSKKEEATKLLEAAKEALKRAELLGYTKKFDPEYKNLTKSINAIEKEIKGKNDVEKLYDKIKEDFTTLIKHAHDSKTQVKNRVQAEKKVNNYEKKEDKKAIQVSKVFEKDAIQGEKK